MSATSSGSLEAYEAFGSVEAVSATGSRRCRWRPGVDYLLGETSDPPNLADPVRGMPVTEDSPATRKDLFSGPGGSARRLPDSLPAFRARSAGSRPSVGESG